MNMKKVLFLYITENSGHHMAAKAIQEAMELYDASVQTMCLNALAYTNPIMEKVLVKTYISMLKTTPEIWDYLYDNPKVVQKTTWIREFINKSNSTKLESLLYEFLPSAIVCTQAFPCGVIAAFKSEKKIDIPLIAVVTDYMVHSYWVYENVDLYIVPTKECRKRLIDEGIDKEKIEVIGIPIKPHFGKRIDIVGTRKSLGLIDNIPTILLMGGGHGIGPFTSIVDSLEEIEMPIQLLIVTGANKGLREKLIKKVRNYDKITRIFGYVEEISDLMDVSDLIITKPGGITSTESLVKGLPMIIVTPIPGQEEKNTEYLVNNDVAIQVGDESNIVGVVRDLLLDSDRLASMKEKAINLVNNEASTDISKIVAQNSLRIKMAVKY